MIETLLSVASKLLSIVAVFQKANRDRKDRIAIYFEGISKCIDDLVAVRRSEDAARSGTLRSCTELDTYAEKFLETVGDTIPKPDAEKLAKDLAQACFYRALVGEVASTKPEELEHALEQLERAAGMFKGLSASIRAAP